MGFLPLSVSLFPVGLPLRPTLVQMDAGESSCEGERAQMFDFIPNLFVCSYAHVACLSQNFLSFFTQFVQVNLLKSKLHRSVLGLPPWSLSRATALILHYSAYLLRPCVYVQLCTRFPLTLDSEKITAFLASSVEQTTALSKYLPAPTLSQLAQVDFRTKVQMRPGHALMTSNRNKYVPPHTFCCI